MPVKQGEGCSYSNDDANGGDPAVVPLQSQERWCKQWPVDCAARDGNAVALSHGLGKESNRLYLNAASLLPFTEYRTDTFCTGLRAACAP